MSKKSDRDPRSDRSLNSDRNLLIGILALQLDFISRDQLVDAMTAWAASKEKSLEQVLHDSSLIDERTRSLLAELVDRRLAGESRHSSVRVSLPPEELDALQTELESLGDADVVHSFATLMPPRRVESDERPPQISLVAENLETIDQLTQNGPPDGTCRYRVVRPHAKGGLGEVSIALDNELNRHVALKQIRPSHADDDSARQRFVLEAEVTGGLEHPGVVPVYGLGNYDDGRPYYAMRFIRGDSLRDAVDRFHKSATHLSSEDFSLGLRKLLDRFLDVCQTIEYAHSRGVLHRDIKPDNIMLGAYGETLVVDWGLAKAAGQETPAVTVGETQLKPASASGSAPTQMGSVIGTPAFMSPEQADGQLELIGPRSDVYSLGATLYFVLTGKIAVLAAEGEESLDVGQVLKRVIQGQYPLPRALNGAVPKPLEAVCLKAMSVQPVDRYSTSKELSEDLERYLADSPVSAYTESAIMRARRWLRRHQTFSTTAAALVLVSLVGLLAFSSILTAKQAELEASNRELIVAEGQARESASEAELKRLEAETERNNAQEALAIAKLARENTANFSRFLSDHILTTAQPKGENGGLGIDVTVIKALEEAEKKISDVFKDTPQAEVTARSSIGQTWYSLGRLEKAEYQQRRVIELSSALGQDDDRLLHAKGAYASTLRELGRIDEAIRLGLEVAEGFRTLNGPKAPETLTAENNLAIAYQDGKQFDKALSILERTVPLEEGMFGKDNPKSFAGRINLAEALRLGDSKARLRAGEMLESVVADERRILGESHPETLRGLNNLATFYEEEGRAEDAVTVLEESVGRLKTSLGPDHPDVIISSTNLGNSLFVAGRLEEGLATLEAAVELATQKLSSDHPTTLNTLDVYANRLAEVGDLERGIELLTQVVQQRRRVLGDTDSDTLNSINNLANLFSQVGRNEEAVALSQEVLLHAKENYGEDSRQHRKALINHGRAATAAADFDTAIVDFENLVSILVRTEGSNSRETWDATSELAGIFKANGEQQKSTTMLLKLTNDMQKVGIEPDDSQMVEFKTNLAIAFRDTEDFESAAKYFAELVGILDQQAKSGTFEARMGLRSLLIELANCENQLAEFAEASKHAWASIDIAAELLPGDWRLFNARSVLGSALAGQAKPEAEATLLEAHTELESRAESFPGMFLENSFDRIIAYYSGEEDAETADSWRERKRTWETQLDNTGATR